MELEFTLRKLTFSDATEPLSNPIASIDVTPSGHVDGTAALISITVPVLIDPPGVDAAQTIVSTALETARQLLDSHATRALLQRMQALDSEPWAGGTGG